jgi:hypothetical protein
MDRESIVRVLLVGETREHSSHLGSCSNACQCHFSESDWEAAELLNSAKFDIVLGTHEIAGGSIDQLAAYLSGSRASLFYSMPDEKGYRCYGSPVWQAVLRNAGANGGGINLRA